MTCTTDDLSEMARTHYGYGEWEAPYWFIGPEPGQDIEEADIGQDGLLARCTAWKQLGGGELLDCRDHHLAFGYKRWHPTNALPPIQRTWGKLIRLLLIYQGVQPTSDCIKAYQRDCWGRARGETCVLELGALAAKSLRTTRDRSSFRSERIKNLREKAIMHSPTFIVCYGLGNKGDYEKIAGTFDKSNVASLNGGFGFLAPHPVSYGTRNVDWERFGSDLRKRMAAGAKAHNKQYV
jgi:hypothetical protein